MMRIITGRARGTKLDTLSGENTRPTAERTKEAVFSILQFHMADARVLDLFAGSGQLALEAISRGAKKAILCDRSKDAVAVIHRNVQKTHFEHECSVFYADYQTLLQMLAGKERFDLVFLDPPYASGAVPIALRGLLTHGLLADGARIVCETGEEKDAFGDDLTLSEAFQILKTTRYGAAFITILEYHDKENLL